MSRLIELPHPADSLLGRMDPRWKLAGVVLAAVAAACVRTPAGAAALLAEGVTLVVLGRVPARWYLTRAGAVLLFVFLFVVWLPFTAADHAAWNIGPLPVSPRGVRAAVLVLLRASALVTLALVLLGTSPVNELLGAAHGLGVPGVLTQTGLLTHRYVHVLAREWRALRVALRVRAFRNRASRHAYRTLGNAAGTLLVRGTERAERVAHAMRCRGFDGRFRTLRSARTRAADVVMFLFVAGVASGVVAAEAVAGDGPFAASGKLAAAVFWLAPG